MDFGSPSELDWETAMTRTQESAEKSAERSERILRGVAELLEQQRVAAHRLTQAMTTIDQLRASIESAPPPQTNKIEQTPHEAAPIGFRRSSFPFVVVFAVVSIGIES